MKIFKQVMVCGVLLAFSLLYLSQANAQDEKATPKPTAPGPYEIVRATADRVWRLNRNTGEISVCTLEDVNLICTNSTEAMKPPAKTYEEREMERATTAAEAAKQREAKKARDLELIDKILESIKSLVKAASEQETTE